MKTVEVLWNMKLKLYTMLKVDQIYQVKYDILEKPVPLFVVIEL